jgi:hypothetical protein
MSRIHIIPALLMLAACNVQNPAATDVYDGDPMGRIAGNVVDVDGQPLAGIQVSVDGLTAITDGEGFYTLEAVAPGNNLVVQFTAPGFAKNYETTQLVSWETVPVDATMSEIDGYGIFASEVGGVIKVDLVTVEFGPNAIVYDDDGSFYAGDVTVEITHVDPYSAEIAFAPGDLTALAFADGDAKDATEPAQLVSYGMLDVSLYDEDGEPLQLAEGETADINMPITNGSLPELYHLGSGDEQQTWSFDPSKGIWVEEGMGEVVPQMVDIIDDDPESETYGEVIGTEATGDMAFSFEASHFSWWNCDQGFVPSCAYGRVVDMLGFPVRGARLDAQGGQSNSTVFTDEDGNYVVTIMVGDSVTYTGTTQVGGSNWSESYSKFMSGYGSGSSDCEPLPDLVIDVCRESGIVMADNLDLHISGMDEGQNGDQLRAWFWEPPGEPWRCDNPWEELEVDECVAEKPENYPAQFLPRSVGIASDTRSVGSWLNMSTPRDDYHMDEADFDGNPVYVYETLELSDKASNVIVHDVDLRAGDSIRGTAPGAADNYFGPIDNEQWLTLPADVDISVSGPQVVSRASGWNVNFTGQGNQDNMLVMVTGDPDNEGLLCKYADDGSINIGAADLTSIEPGWASVSIYRPEVGWTTGPDGLPIRIQGLSGAIVEAELK